MIQNKKYLYIKIFLSIGLSFFLQFCAQPAKLNLQMELKDLTPPRIISVTPLDGSTEVTDKPNIVIVFNEAMDAATLNSATVTIQSENGTPATGKYDYDDSTYTLTVQIIESLYLNTKYTIQVTKGVTDKAGNPIEPFSSSFTTDVCPKAKKGKPVFNYNITSLAKIGCTLFVGGAFTSVSQGYSYGVALDPNSGEKMPSFTYEDINGPVNTVAPDGNGGWYIGGSFTKIGRYSRNRLAHLAANGEVLPWNPSANGDVYKIIVSGSTVYIGGAFTEISGVSRSALAAVDTSGNVLSWNPQVGITSGSPIVFVLLASGNTIYVGGIFSTINGQSRNNLAAVDTSGNLLSFNPNLDNAVYALAISGTTLYVGGDFTTVGGGSTTRNKLAAFDTSTGNITGWNPNANARVSALAVVGSNIYVGGQFTSIGVQTRKRLAAVDASGAVKAWNPEMDNNVYTLTAIGNTLYVGGKFQNVGCASGCDIIPQISRNYVAAFDTSTNTLLSWNPNTNNQVNVLASSSTAVYAGGFFTGVASQTRNYLAAVSTDGTILSWNPDVTGSEIKALLASNSTIYVGGTFSQVGGTTRNNLAAVDFNGNVTSFNPNVSGGVNALALINSTLYIGGGFTTVSTTTRNYLAAWDLSTNSLATFNPNLDSAVFSLATSGTTLFVGGDFTMVGGSTSRNRLAAFDTSTGTLLSWNPNVNNRVSSFLVSGNRIYMGGLFTLVGTTAQNYAASVQIDSTCLTSYSSTCLLPWDPGITGTGAPEVSALVMYNSIIYAGGSFTGVAGSSQKYIAAFDENGTLQSWNPGPDNFIFALLASGSTIYMAGRFTTLASSPHFYLASVNTDGTINW
ncbi:MAG: hypothetical protein D6767_07870 [Candidatus Hydrogenedentota bacterium]|nr:MAG: hypothetical protein D6767_07870 [Candidatus Hydrogenedentota bacterium]